MAHLSLILQPEHSLGFILQIQHLGVEVLMVSGGRVGEVYLHQEQIMPIELREKSIDSELEQAGQAILVNPIDSICYG